MIRLMARWTPAFAIGMAALSQAGAGRCLAGDLFHHHTTTFHHKAGYTKTKTVTKIYHAPVATPVATAPAATVPVAAAPMVAAAPLVQVTHYVPVYAAPVTMVPVSGPVTQVAPAPPTAASVAPPAASAQATPQR